MITNHTLKDKMNIKDLKQLIFESYVEVIREQNAVLPTGSEQIISKFPTLRKNLENLLTKDYNSFVKEIKYTAPKPTTFTVVLVNGQMFYLKWIGKGFESQIGGKKYFLGRVDQFQQALDKLNELLKHNPIGGEEPPAEGEDDSAVDSFGGDTGAPEPDTTAPEPTGDEVEFEEEPAT